MIPSVGFKISSEFKNMNLNLTNIVEFNIPDVLTLTFSLPRVLFSSRKEKSLKPSLLFFEINFMSCCLTIFTDGSKDGYTAGSACVTPSDTSKCRLPNNASIFSAEIKAVDLPLDHNEQSRNTDSIIFSDFLSDLQSLHNSHIENSLLLDVLLKQND